MKNKLIILIIALCVGFILSTSSCVVFLKSDKGNHNGWYSNPGNPHNTHHKQSLNPGKSEEKHKN